MYIHTKKKQAERINLLAELTTLLKRKDEFNFLNFFEFFGHRKDKRISIILKKSKGFPVVVLLYSMYLYEYSTYVHVQFNGQSSGREVELRGNVPVL